MFFTALGKGLKKILSNLTDERLISQLEEDYLTTFTNSLSVADIDAELELESLWVDADGDVGVDEFKTKDETELRILLRLPPTGRFPYMNRWRHELGLLPDEIWDFQSFDSNDELTEAEAKTKRLVPLNPHWHQFVGVAAAVKRIFNGNNILLADGVGVGKTCEAFMLMSLLRYYRGNQARLNGKLSYVAKLTTLADSPFLDDSALPPIGA